MPLLDLRSRRLLGAFLALGLLAVISGDVLRTAAPRPAGGDACGPAISKADGSRWECSFVDEFEGTTLDPDKWTTQDTAVTGFKSELTCYRGADNVTVRAGTLLLAAENEGALLNCDNAYGAFRTPYSGGAVTTRGHFSQAYGRFEVRAQWPSTRLPGLHGAIWMFPLEPTYGPWPASGEIDIAEWWSNAPSAVLPSLHFNGRVPARDTGWGCQVADASEWHVYAAEWEPSEVRFSIDGETCFTTTWTPTPPQVAPQPFDQPFSLILLMGVGPATGPNRVSATTELPATLVIDYAKAWR